MIISFIEAGAGSAGLSVRATIHLCSNVIAPKEKPEQCRYDLVHWQIVGRLGRLNNCEV
jgi:hypothetical protein